MDVIGFSVPAHGILSRSALQLDEKQHRCIESEKALAMAAGAVYQRLRSTRRQVRGASPQV
jgi:hypothetical protein